MIFMNIYINLQINLMYCQATMVQGSVLRVITWSPDHMFNLSSGPRHYIIFCGFSWPKTSNITISACRSMIPEPPPHVGLNSQSVSFLQVLDFRKYVKRLDGNG